MPGSTQEDKKEKKAVSIFRAERQGPTTLIHSSRVFSHKGNSLPSFSDSVFACVLNQKVRCNRVMCKSCVLDTHAHVFCHVPATGMGAYKLPP
eukprot:1160432-Pelagomonas_calceolata.AAC.15